MSKERDVIKLDSNQHNMVCVESYLEIDGKEVEIEDVSEEHVATYRHDEEWHKIFKVVETGKFYGINYRTSVKDSMGWQECNFGDQYEAVEVFPETKTITIYK